MHVGFSFPSHPGFVDVEVVLAMGGDVAPLLALWDLADDSVRCLVTEVLLMMLYLHIPEAIVFILIGTIGGGIGLLSFQICQDSFAKLEQVSAREFMLIFLAPIIFPEGYHLKCTQFFSNITRILVFAFVRNLPSFAECLTFQASSATWTL